MKLTFDGGLTIEGKEEHDTLEVAVRGDVHPTAVQVAEEFVRRKLGEDAVGLFHLMLLAARVQAQQ